MSDASSRSGLTPPIQCLHQVTQFEIAINLRATLGTTLAILQQKACLFRLRHKNGNQQGEKCSQFVTGTNVPYVLLAVIRTLSKGLFNDSSESGRLLTKLKNASICIRNRHRNIDLLSSKRRHVEAAFAVNDARQIAGRARRQRERGHWLQIGAASAHNPRSQRTRPSALLRTEVMHLPDFPAASDRSWIACEVRPAMLARESNAISSGDVVTGRGAERALSTTSQVVSVERGVAFEGLTTTGAGQFNLGGHNATI